MNIIILLWRTEQQKPNLLWDRVCFGCYCWQCFNQFFWSCAITIHSTAERLVLSLWHLPIETIFKTINKSAVLLLHLLKDEEGPTSPQTASQLQQPCWDLLLGERNSLSSKFEKHLHSWKPNLPNMENAWVYWKKDYVRKYPELQTQEMSCLDQVPDSNQGSQPSWTLHARSPPKYACPVSFGYFDLHLSYCELASCSQTKRITENIKSLFSLTYPSPYTVNVSVIK